MKLITNSIGMTGVASWPLGLPKGIRQWFSLWPCFFFDAYIELFGRQDWEIGLPYFFLLSGNALKLGVVKVRRCIDGAWSQKSALSTHLLNMVTTGWF